MPNRDTGKIIHLFTTTPDVKIECFTERTVFKHLTIPVNIRENIRIQSLASSVNTFLCISFFPCRLITYSFIIKFHKGNTIHKLRYIGRRRHTTFHTKIYNWFIQGSTGLGRHNHHTISTTHTIHCSCCCILQN